MDEADTSNLSNLLIEKNESGKNFDCENTDLEKFAMEAFNVLVKATKSVHKLPFGKTRDLYESCPAFHKILKFQEQEVLSILSAIIKRTDIKGNIQKRDDEDKFEMIVDLNDSLLEKVSICLDEISGVQKNLEPNFFTKKVEVLNKSQNVDVTDWQKCTQILNAIANKTKNMEKPQLKFSDKINNDGTIPFEPKIKYKFNLLKPLSIIISDNRDGVCQYSHPYEFELIRFKPLPTQLRHQEPVLFKALNETPFKMIEKKEDIPQLVQDLLKCSEIAIDLEHHSYRSFQGFTCLIQISTRDADYIIDALALRAELEELNEVFTNPSIVKVFHGADFDILWLQRDFSLYIVNMFDTHQAAKLLKYPKLSLSYLLKHYCNVNAQKCFQLADWRIRPLPEELLLYAREDTHYLLYIYDQLRNKLIEKGNGQTNMLESVIHESSRICLKTYEKPVLDKDGYLDVYHRSKKLFDNRQKLALKNLFEWRDKTARELDESIGYVLPNHMMLNISEVLPREAQGILACCNPIPPPVRQNLLHLHQLILKAREEPLVKPILDEQGFCRNASSVNFSENSLYCPHDLNHEEDFRDDLPVLLSEINERLSISNTCDKNDERCQYPIIDVFEKLSAYSLSPKKVIYSNAYSRYKLAKKYFESLELQNNNINDDKCTNDPKNVNETNPSKNMQSKENKINESSDFSNINSEVRMNNEKSNENIEKVSRKRTSNEDLGVPSKMLKRENNSETIDSIEESYELRKELGKSGKKKKEKHRKMPNTHFVPYSYETADFDKYKAFNLPQIKKCKKNNRRRGKVTVKNLKISI